MTSGYETPWRTKQQAEVDFIKVTNRKPTPIEVKSALKEPVLPNGMRAFLDRYPETPEAFVVRNVKAEEIVYRKTIVEFIAWHEVDQI